MAMKRPAPFDSNRSKAAALRASKLLWSHLSDAQRRTYCADRFFIVRGSRSGWRYVITPNDVYVVEPARDVIHYCLDVEGACECGCGEPGDDEPPIEDVMLAKKIIIECAEPLFLTTANPDLMAGSVSDWAEKYGIKA
jgi:hypothetical protein